MSETIFHLPLPPSVNALWFNRKGRGGRARTETYNRWREQAGWEILRQRVPKAVGPVLLAYEVAEAGKFDLGNVEKPLSDLLVEHQIIAGDDRKTVRGISLTWSDVLDGVLVTIRPAADRPF